MEESTLLSTVLEHRCLSIGRGISQNSSWNLLDFELFQHVAHFAKRQDPQHSAHWEGGVRVWFLVHCLVIFFIKNAHNEWDYFPLVQRNLYFLYGIVTIGFAIGQYSFAREVGPDLGFFYGGLLCQTLASLGPIAQILSRNSTRGASLLTLSLRAVATFGGFIKLTIYYLTGNAAGPWFESPMCKFYIGLTLILDFT
ncbi:hypothetical protein N7530_011646 [Penicillium desertorum]|uniref:Uncharacterized protein n=1 Tax=Penicillium desertorum TaxID=1303715 RepID=A0A9X0BFU3_9EURO|nr:hypothetical protein N7530_011646 [Penicillium desertorum]